MTLYLSLNEGLNRSKIFFFNVGLFLTIMDLKHPTLSRRKLQLNRHLFKCNDNVYEIKLICSKEFGRRRKLIITR